jgi:hypothetical protein
LSRFITQRLEPSRLVTVTVSRIICDTIDVITESAGVATQLARQLADPKPADARTIQQLDRYKGLDERWTDWGNVTDVCRLLAVEMVQ